MVEGDPLDFIVEEVHQIIWDLVVMVDQSVVDHLQTEGLTGWVEVCEEDEEVYLREV